MIDDPAAVVSLLRGTALDGRPASVVTIDPNDRAVLVVECDADEVLPAWQAARARLDETGRWPVVVAAWSGDEIGADVFSRFPYSHGADGDQSPAAVCARADAIDADHAVAALWSQHDALRWGDWPETIRFECDATAQQYGTGPTVDDVIAALGDDCGSLTLDRWLFDWEQRAEAGGVQPIAPTTSHQDWYEPVGHPCGVALLPTPHGWQAPAWCSFFGAEVDGGHERLIAVLRQWNERWGAELVANWGTMLEFVVARPPPTAAEAYPIAVAHTLLAGSTIWPSGVGVREHARTLVDRTTWFLHDRP